MIYNKLIYAQEPKCLSVSIWSQPTIELTKKNVLEQESLCDMIQYTRGVKSVIRLRLTKSSQLRKWVMRYLLTVWTRPRSLKTLQSEKTFQSDKTLQSEKTLQSDKTLQSAFCILAIMEGLKRTSRMYNLFYSYSENNCWRTSINKKQKN